MRLQHLQEPKAFRQAYHSGFKKILGCSHCENCWYTHICVLPPVIRGLCCCTQALQLTSICCRGEQSIRYYQSLQTLLTSLRCLSVHNRVPEQRGLVFRVCSMVSALTLCSSDRLVVLQCTTACRIRIDETSLCRDVAARIKADRQASHMGGD